MLDCPGQEAMSCAREAYRSLRAAPEASLFAILSLALGVGSSVTVFSIANALLLKSRPVSEPERLAHAVAGDDGRRGYRATDPAWTSAALLRDPSAGGPGA